MIKITQRTLAFTFLVFIAAIAAAHGDADGGFVIKTVVPDGAAAAAGVEVGDKILRVGEQDMETQEDLNEVLGAHGPGDTVPFVVGRDGEELELELTFHERSDGGPSIGVSVTIVGTGAPSGEAVAGPTLTRPECVVWADDRYDVAARARELGPDFEADAKALRACHESDIQGMPSPMPVGWCDNSFKIHCSGVDLLTEIAEVQVEGCEELLGEKLSSCASQKVFDRYSKDGQLSDQAACIAARDSCSGN